MNERLARALALIDEANSEDPNREVWNGERHPREWLYGHRMSEWLERLDPEASDVLKIAARGQHIRRWEVPRQDYPATREGYLAWRSYLYKFHAELLAQIMRRVGYDEASIRRVENIATKRGLKHDGDVQLIEDVACLVFLSHYFAEFARSHEEAKVIAILRKTWRKMSELAHREALRIDYPAFSAELVRRALAA